MSYKVLIGTSRCLIKHLDSLAQTAQSFLLAQECRDVEHARTLAYAYQCKTEGIHNVAQLVALVLNPLHNDRLLALDREVVYRLEYVGKLAHNLGRVFLPTLLYRLGVILCRCDEEE